MKTIYSFFTTYAVFVLLTVNTYASSNQETIKLSPLTKHFIYLYNQNNYQQSSDYIDDPQFDPYVFYDIEGELFVGGLMKINDKFDLQAAENTGAIFPTRAGNIYSFLIKVDDFDKFTNLDGIINLEIDLPVTPLLDKAREDVDAGSVYSGVNLESGYTGNGVVVGVVDAGFDFTHPDYVDRIQRVWIQSMTGRPPSGFGYGHEIDNIKRTNIWYDLQNETHGTHVTGIAAGAGNLNPLYQGIAPGSDLVMVSYLFNVNSDDVISTGMSSIVNAVNYIFKYADAVDKPAVVNLSLGNHIGPHDGTGLFARAADNISGYGKIICVAAGNSGHLNLHIGKDFNPMDTMIVSQAVSLRDQSSIMILDAWGDFNVDFCMSICTIRGGQVYCADTYCAQDYSDLQIQDNVNNSNLSVIYYVTRSDFNGKPRILAIVNGSIHSEPVILAIKSRGGIVHVWNAGEGGSLAGEFRENNQIISTSGDKLYSLNGMGAHSEHLITVGAYTGKNRFRNIYDNFVTIPYYEETGELAAFSSTGPTADGRIKPDITAPGNVVVSALSSFYSHDNTDETSLVECVNYGGRDYCYGAQAGTSMATPVVTGVVALMLQANPDLTPEIAKDILFQTAIEDEYTGNLPPQGNIYWGHGKINAYDAVAMAEGVIIERPEDFDIVFYPNPVENTLRFDLDSAYSGTYHFEMYDLIGNKVLEWTEEVDNEDLASTINMATLARGAYFISIKFEERYMIYRKIFKMYR